MLRKSKVIACFDMSKSELKNLVEGGRKKKKKTFYDGSKTENGSEYRVCIECKLYFTGWRRTNRPF